MSGYTVVLPTVGRPSLREVVDDLLAQEGPAPEEVIVVDDRPLDQDTPLDLPAGVHVLRPGARRP